MISSIAAALVALALGSAATWWGSNRLEESSARLARFYDLPVLVQGTLVVAVGSSFPELTTTVLSTALHGEFELGMSAIVGSAIFNILVIPALAGLTGEPVAHGERLVYRDAQFYLTSVAVLLLTFSFALIYEPVEDAAGLAGTLTRPIALVPLSLYVLYLFLQQQDAADHRRDAAAQLGPRRASAAAAERTSAGPGRDWALLVASLVVIVVGVEALVRSVLFLGDRFGVPSFFWGITVVAAVTSLPDALVSYRAARKGEAAVSLGNVLGSNIFDLLVALPAGVLVAGATVVDFGVAAPMMAMLTLATIVLFAAMRTGVVLSRWEAWLLLGLYGLFLVWAGAETLGVVDLIDGS